MFGVSEANATTDIYGPNSPAGKLYQKLTGHRIPSETDGDYSQLVEIFDALQAAGPDLTPQNMARGLHALPVLGAPSYGYGAWSWNVGPTGTPGQGNHSVAHRRPIRLVERGRDLAGQRQAGVVRRLGQRQALRPRPMAEDDAVGLHLLAPANR